MASLLKINFLGTFTTILFVSAEFFFLAKNINAGNSEHVSPFPYLTLIFTTRPVGSILMIVSLFLSPYLFFFFGNKYAIVKVANRLIKDKAATMIYPFLDKVLQKVYVNQPSVVRDAGDYSMNKMRVIQEIKNDKTENKWVRRVLVFALKKINLDDINFATEKLNFYDIIKFKTIQTLENITTPSRNIIWAIIAGQLVIFLFIAFTKF